MRTHGIRSLIVILLVLIGLGVLLRLLGHMVGAARWRHVPRSEGSIPVPEAHLLRWETSSPLTEALLSDWASRPLPDWQEEGKVNAPRVLMAKFALKADLDAANAYLQAQVPWGRSGSTWELHEEGDYDFTLAALTAILYLYGDDPDVLYPETRAHLLDTLLIEEGARPQNGRPRTGVPRTLGLVRDTENHLLMTEGSRYLKNRWLMLHGSDDPDHDNVGNGLEAWMLELLGELQTAGLYEFNSIPYMGYTLTALMNLEAWGSEDVQDAAHEVLDRVNWMYALGSLNYRRFPPFRRQLRRADLTVLDADYHTSMIKTWMSLHPDHSPTVELTEGRHHALWAALLPYRLPDRTARWILEKPESYFVRIGHGPWSSPEIYSGGPGYLLSAGGVHRGKRSMIVARPITLMLDETVAGTARELEDVLHLAGPGKSYTTWNNTGVHRDFAVADGRVHVPDDWGAEAANELWAVYAVAADLSIAVHSRSGLGIVAIFHDGDARAVLNAVSKDNSSAMVLERTFRWPNGPELVYNTNAPKNRWVIVAVDGEPVDRTFDRWPLMDGEIGE